MYLRTIFATPLLLALSLNLTAQEKPATPPQGKEPAERIEELVKERARLEQEIRYTKERATNAKSNLMSRLKGARAPFRSIDAGMPARAIPKVAPKRKRAVIGTTEQLARHPDGTMVIVENRTIGRGAFDNVMEYMKTSGIAGDDSVHAQRVLFDMIRIEAMAAKFYESEGEGDFGAALTMLNKGSTMADVIEKYGAVRGSDDKGLLEVRRNSVHGPYFEHIAFGTEAGKRSRPFRNLFGYVLLEVVEKKKGATPQQDSVVCRAAQVSYTKNVQEVSQAQMAINTGQIEVIVANRQVYEMLPQMFRPRQEVQPLTEAAQLKLQVLRMKGTLNKLKAQPQVNEKLVQETTKKLQAMEAELKRLEDEQKKLRPQRVNRPGKDGKKKGGL